MVAVSAGSSLLDNQKATVSLRSDRDTFHIEVTSSWCISSDEADRQVDEQLNAQLTKLVRKLYPRQDELLEADWLGRLLIAPSVQLVSDCEQRQKQHGAEYQQHIKLQLPRATISHWQAEQAVRLKNVREMCFVRGAALLASWIGILLIATIFKRNSPACPTDLVIAASIVGIAASTWFVIVK